jgi:hypothetical protein
VAKTPKRSRKTGRSRAAKRTSRKASAPRRATPSAGRVLDLKQLRRDLDRAVAGLSRRVERAGEPSAKISEAQTLLTRWAAEIDDICDPDEQEICGPTMAIPLN